MNDSVLHDAGPSAILGDSVVVDETNTGAPGATAEADRLVSMAGWRRAEIAGLLRA